MAWGGGGSSSVDAWVTRLRENDVSFTSLHILSFRRVTPSELGRVFDALAGNTTLKEIYASGHTLDVDCARLLAKALEQNSTLEKLNVGNDALGSQEEIIEILAASLAKNRGLFRFDLENKCLGGYTRSVQALANALASKAEDGTGPSLKELNLARNKLSDQDIHVLSEGLSKNSTLQKLDICLNSFGIAGTQTIATYLAGQTNAEAGLVEIDLSDNEITEDGGVAIGNALATNKSLKRLRLSSAMDPPLPVEEGQEDFIPFDSSLEELNASLTPEQEAEIKMDGDTVLIAIAESLKCNDSLQELWMDYCNISAVGATALASALRHNHGLITIRMRNNQFGNRGARAVGAALTPTKTPYSAGHEQHLAYNKTLRNLELGSNNIGVLGWYGLVGASSLESLGLFANKVHVLHEALENYSGSSSETAPEVSSLMANGAALSAMALERLAHLDVGCNRIPTEDFTQLGVSLIKGLLPALVRLEIAGNGNQSESEPEQPPSDGDDDTETPDNADKEAWNRVTERVEEARPNLTIDWKVTVAQQQ